MLLHRQYSVFNIH